MFAILSLSLIASAAAFNGVSRMPPCASSSGLKMSTQDRLGSAEDMVGSLDPVGFFDPLGLSAGKTEGELKRFREAELKHGRVSMVAFLGIMVGEAFNPFFDGKISGAAIYQFQQADNLLPYFWVLVLFAIALVEGQNILAGWESPAETNAKPSGIANLKESYVNGDLGFDPLGLKPTDAAEFNEMRTKELQNGRLAMLGVAGIIAQELVNQQGVMENLLGGVVKVAIKE